MNTLFNISSRYSEILSKIDNCANFEPDTDADGNFIDDNGNVIDDPVMYKYEMMTAMLDTLDSIEGEMEDKLANCAAFIKQLTAEADALDNEIKSLKNRSASKKKEIDTFKNYVISCMERTDTTKVDKPLAKFFIRQNPESASIPNEREFIEWAQSNKRAELLRFPSPEVNKTAVKTALKSGEFIPGASLARTKSLTIK